MLGPVASYAYAPDGNIPGLGLQVAPPPAHTQVRPPLRSRPVTTTYGRIPYAAGGIPAAPAIGGASACTQPAGAVQLEFGGLGPPVMQAPGTHVASGMPTKMALQPTSDYEQCRTQYDPDSRFYGMYGSPTATPLHWPLMMALQAFPGYAAPALPDAQIPAGNGFLQASAAIPPPAPSPGGLPSFIPHAPPTPTAAASMNSAPSGGSTLSQSLVRPPSYVPAPINRPTHAAATPTSVCGPPTPSEGLRHRAVTGGCLSYVAPPLPPATGRKIPPARAGGSYVPAPWSGKAPSTPSASDSAGLSMCWVPPPLAAPVAVEAKPLPAGVPVWSPPGRAFTQAPMGGTSSIPPVDVLSRSTLNPTMPLMTSPILPFAPPNFGGQATLAVEAASEPMTADIDAGERKPYVPPYCPNRVPTVDGVEHLEPKEVHHLLSRRACLLVDLRSEDRAAGLINPSINIPAIAEVPFYSRIDELAREWQDQRLVVFTCQYSAHRAPQCANWYRAKANPAQRVAILSGGFRGWEAEGLPVSSVAAGREAQAADKLALSLGTHFIGSLR
mmetsp:Transcript_48909/g.116257  ORF Transcript_48909/g.116257 Transcript_48909/m.116257 type:complete len:555 (+) Transcript_48909:178-1842(+)